MDFTSYLAGGEAQLCRLDPKSHRPAYFACHFSEGGRGLCHLPRQLPPGAMLMLNDQTPINGHDPDLVARQLCEAVAATLCNAIALDLQRKSPEAPAVIEAIAERAPCPVGVSEGYAHLLSGPVLVSPSPLWTDPRTLLAPWGDRPIWLEAVPEEGLVTVDAGGSRYESLAGSAFVPRFFDAVTCTEYLVKKEPGRVRIYLRRDRHCLQTLARELGVAATVGFL